jgi:hypothetical protein
VDSVVDSNSLNPDPDTDLDPAFPVNMDAGTYLDPVQIQGFDDQKLKKIVEQFFVIKNFNLLIPCPP